MEQIDTQSESHIDMGYRRLLDCDVQGQPKQVLKGLGNLEVLDHLLAKERTVMRGFPHGISEKVKRGTLQMELAR
jgi:hypothetical protein